MFQSSSFTSHSVTAAFQPTLPPFHQSLFFPGEPEVVGLTVNGEISELLCLNLETLTPFEVIDRQFESLGITFNNAIALKPSNPAFPTYSGQMLLLASPDNGMISMTFAQPVSYVSGRVTSSRPTIVTAYNCLGQELVRKKLPSANLAGSNAPIPPNELLFVQARNIHKVTFYAFDGQLTLDAISLRK
jgi:hypothetical protein